MQRDSRLRASKALRASDFETDDPNRASRTKARERKTGQLCAQVHRVLSFLLDSECSYDCLQGIYVEAVVPNPHAGCLLVVLRPRDVKQPLDRVSVQDRLAAVKGYWRSEISKAIHRKKTPELVFAIVSDGVSA